MVEAVDGAGVVNVVGFNYRHLPAIQTAKEMIESGALGEIFHFRACSPSTTKPRLTSLGLGASAQKRQVAAPSVRWALTLWTWPGISSEISTV
jgi:hypothetical protein